MAQEQATFAGGCFWCTEAIFADLIGVESVESGYIGGHLQSPSYEAICRGNTGHAEAVRIAFDPDRISYSDLLEVFFATHDPTQLNRQGNDVGTQYRSAIFPHSADQERLARSAIERASHDWDRPIVTVIEPLSEWYPAETYHQQYFATVGDRNPYCMAVIAPKLRKFRKSYAERLKG
jgi:peptide-methionine (S)-S-oxide reductase